MDALNHEMELVDTSVNFKREMIQCNELEETQSEPQRFEK